MSRLAAAALLLALVGLAACGEDDKSSEFLGTHALDRDATKAALPRPIDGPGPPPLPRPIDGPGPPPLPQPIDGPPPPPLPDPAK